eukprot:CAMPEP_0179348438 /NCGR_PEP_ID=MMETSP0797-20121207/73696_1 /TAXON_ID=47934 /ORGANISM="Dinophysis acuminata, Strain DAEP01" /LENGTH=472 /DNA_ID=CAMNT_0021063231 /DNA_START=1 /DNA_END=1415 /DNA_ORIENTATION=-
MGCLQSVGQTSDTTVWKCQYCGAAFRTYEEADRHEKFQCSYKQSAGGMQAPAYAQNPYGNAVANQLAGGGGYKPGQHAAQPQQQPVHLKCGKCGQVMGVPPGHAQVICPRCGVVNACPQPQQPVATIPQQVYNQHLGQQPAAGVGEPGPPPTGRKRALLIGINYFGTRAELRGCINDVHRMRGLIMGMYGFPGSPDAMTILTDDSSSPQSKPTRANILGALRWLVQGAQPGDVLFLHFSGHGAQQEDPSYTEEDGYDETICPSDFQRAGMVVDDEIFDAIVLPLPPGVKLTAVMDCCHSGTGLDLPYSWTQRGWREEVNPYFPRGDVQLFSGCEDDDVSADACSRYGQAGGAMTTAFCDVLRSHPSPTYAQLMTELSGGDAAARLPAAPAAHLFPAFQLRPPVPDERGPAQHEPLGRARLQEEVPPPAAAHRGAPRRPALRGGGRRGRGGGPRPRRGPAPRLTRRPAAPGPG